MKCEQEGRCQRSAGKLQSFEPLPLYEVMEGLGFENHTIKKSETEYHAYFYRREVKQGKERSEICDMLKEKFGEKNPDVKV